MTVTQELRVYTYREGLLSAVGHDLCMRFDEVEASVEAGQVSAEVKLASLRVEGAVKRGKLQQGALSPKDRADVAHAANTAVLETARHPVARFIAQVNGTRDRVEAKGELTLHGVTQPWALTGRVEGDVLMAQAELKPSRWGIAPYRALGGTLKVQDRVRVEVRLTLPEPLDDPATATLRWTR